jgi:hypothetical protein
MAFDMTGVVTDAEGRPVSGAKVIVWRDYDHLSSVVTDTAGRYKVNFSGAPGSNHVPNADPPGTQDAVAFLEIEAPGYERLAHYILGTAEHLVQNVRLHRRQRIAAGESAVLSIGPDDTVCAVDAWPWRGLKCGIVHVVAQTSGRMTVEAVPTQHGGNAPTLEVYSHSDRSSGYGNPVSIPVTAGIEYIVDVAVPWDTSQSFALNTTMAVVP